MTNFKGTKGKWVYDNHDVSSLNAQDLGDIICLNPNGYGEFSKSGLRWEYNALLISKAPEMLEMLESIINYGGVANFDKIKQLIKEATEL